MGLTLGIVAAFALLFASRKGAAADNAKQADGNTHPALVRAAHEHAKAQAGKAAGKHTVRAATKHAVAKARALTPPAKPSVAPKPKPKPDTRPLWERNGDAGRAAIELREFARATIAEGKLDRLGTQAQRSPAVLAWQKRMQKITADGMYGAQTQARGKKLTGQEFPSRPKPAAAQKPAAAPKALPAPKPATAHTLDLVPGTRYRATLTLTGMDTLASNAQVLNRVQSLIGPWTQAAVTGADAKRTAIGTYAGSARAVKLPSEVTSVLIVAAPAAKPHAAPAAKPHAAAAPKPAAQPARRSPAEAAKRALEIARTPGRNWGTKQKPNEELRACQSDMGSVADGIYGPATRARGQALLGIAFPVRA